MLPDCKNINDALTSYILERQKISKVDTKLNVISSALALKLKIDSTIHFMTKTELEKLMINPNI